MAIERNRTSGIPCREASAIPHHGCQRLVGRPSQAVTDLLMVTLGRQSLKNGRLLNCVQERDITLQELADHFGVSRTAIHHWVHGHRVPKTRMAEKIGMWVLDVTDPDAFAEHTPPTPLRPANWFPVWNAAHRNAYRRPEGVRMSMRLTEQEARDLHWWFECRGGAEALSQKETPYLAVKGVSCPACPTRVN